MLEAEEIVFRRGRRTILDRVSVRIETGKVTALVGPNAAGKSTLLKMLTGEWRPLQGSITLEGRALNEWTARELSRIRAVLPQESELNFPFRAIDVVLLGRLPYSHRTETGRDFQIANAALESMDMLDQRDSLYTTLSGGEKQRVQTARVLAQVSGGENGPSSYLMLDEPTSSLDLSHQFMVLRSAVEFAGNGAAVFVILHDLNHALRYSDSVLVMDGGRIVVEGPPSEVLKPQLVEGVFNVKARIIEDPLSGRPSIMTDPV